MTVTDEPIQWWRPGRRVLAATTPLYLTKRSSIAIFRDLHDLHIYAPRHIESKHLQTCINLCHPVFLTKIRYYIDKKTLLTWQVFETVEEKKETERMWNIEQQIFSSYRNTFKYKFFLKVETFFAKLSNWARLKHQIPFNIRKSAYQKSGRLKLDPQSLDLYKDT